ncbi:MAG: HD domain-containing protein [Candidatus Bathyarchaeia archaeon]
MIDNTLFKRIKKESMEFYRLSHHDKFHVERVYNLALQIAKGEVENVDADVLKAAVLLHDVARVMEDEGKVKNHAAESAKIAKKILQEVGFPKEKIEKVVYCIKAHRFRTNMKPKSMEAQILQDADRLDMLGAIGIARVFNRGGWGNIPIHDPSIPPKEKYDGKSLTSVNHIYEKILKIKDTINTRTGKKIAEERHKFVEQYLQRFLKEWKGEL